MENARIVGILLREALEVLDETALAVSLRTSLHAIDVRNMT